MAVVDAAIKGAVLAAQAHHDDDAGPAAGTAAGGHFPRHRLRFAAAVRGSPSPLVANRRSIAKR